MTTPYRLWHLIKAVEYDTVVEFYRDVLRLPITDCWDRDGSRGTVFGIGETGRIEIETAQSGEAAIPPEARSACPLSIALEYREGLDAVQRRLDPGQSIRRHERGHRGFTIHDPSGTEIYLWSEI